MYSFTKLMCSTCGPDVALERVVRGEHERLDALFEESRRALDDDDLGYAVRRFREFQQGLVEHARWEEQSLFGECTRCGVSGVSQPLDGHRREHQAIETALADMAERLEAAWRDGVARVPELHDVFDALERMLGDHFDAEVGDLAQPLDRTLDAESREMLRTRLRQVHPEKR